jgi:integrase
VPDTHSTPRGGQDKPAKPSPDFPLTPHQAGSWCKKIKGKVHYFGRWNDPEGALREFQAFLAGEPVKRDRRHRKEGGAKPTSPAKPYPEFPLTAHPAGYWCKRIRGKVHYFGPLADPDGALNKYLAQKDALHAGRKPRAETEGLTVKDAANLFLNAKKELVKGGELSPRTWDEYRAMAVELTGHVGESRLAADVDPEDFAGLRSKLAKKWGPHRLKKAVQYIRSIFKHAYDAGFLDKPARFGPGFKLPSMKTLRLHRAKQGTKLFTRDEIRKLLDEAGPSMKAMLLLGINCGFGNADCGNLPLSALDLDGGWVTYPRPKTGINRRCWLWPETVAAVRQELARRKEPSDKALTRLVFLTKRGLSWAKDSSSNPIAHETRKLLDSLGINGHRNFYTLRHTFRTVADEARDQPAADFIMGHEVPHMSSVYRETISDERLKAVSDHVRAWLFPPEKKEKRKKAAT